MKFVLIIISLIVLMGCSNNKEKKENNINTNLNTNSNSLAQNTNTVITNQNNIITNNTDNKSDVIVRKNIYPIKSYTEKELDEILLFRINKLLGEYVNDEENGELIKKEKEKLKPIRDLLIKTINAEDEDGNNALMLAIKYSTDSIIYYDLIKWIVEHGIDLSSKKIFKTLSYDYIKKTSYDHISSKEYSDIAYYLIDSGIYFDYKDVYDLMVNNGNSDIIKKMLDILYDYNFEKVDYNLQSDLLFTSIYNQDIDLVEYFLDLGADINSLNRMRDGSIGTPLMYSAFLENYDIADYLLEKNADVNINCFQDNQELENIWNYYSYYSDERDEIINNFPVLSPTNLNGTVITGNNYNDLVIKILNKTAQNFKLANTYFYYEPTSESIIKSDTNNKYMFISSPILNQEYINYPDDFTSEEDKYFHYITIWKKEDNKASFVSGFYPLQDAFYQYTYLRDINIAVSGNYITAEQYDGGKTYYYTFIIENNELYLDKFSMGKSNLISASATNFSEVYNEEYYYNYKSDAQKFNQTSRVKLIDVEKGFFEKLIEDYNK
ncbi:ankyrin repeat domain-containing protein [Brachyspira intermedia]|uniref:ankyrin repeat domain-containing protein n=1 Tax=Brachyspira intermedia TaxID=84377 RepID=UPI0030075B40